MNVQRYELEIYHCNGGEMLVSETGDYVSHDDYAALEAKCAALAAENAALKEEISNITFMRDDDFFGSTQRAQEVMDRLVNVKTPATDSFLAEVRAQAWVEGREPAEFGRYWVRYETDVGPQYCSAKWMEHNFCAGSDTNIHKIWLADDSRSINSLRGVTHYTKLPDSLE